MKAPAVFRQPRGEFLITGGQDLRRQQPGIQASTDGDRGHRNASWHLHDGVKRIHSGEGLRGHRHADDRQGGEGCHHSR